jgi:hypothetical protein
VEFVAAKEIGAVDTDIVGTTRHKSLQMTDFARPAAHRITDHAELGDKLQVMTVGNTRA